MSKVVSNDDYIIEEEYMELWSYDPLRKYKEFCPSKFIDKNDEYAYLIKWYDSFIAEMFPTDTIWKNNEMYYNQKKITDKYSSIDKYKLRVIGFVRDQNINDYTAEELMKINEEIEELLDKLRA